MKEAFYKTKKFNPEETKLMIEVVKEVKRQQNYNFI